MCGELELLWLIKDWLQKFNNNNNKLKMFIYISFKFGMVHIE
jgi:ABC-type nickel/cobalt efflux system permease component RcnA